MKIPYAFLAIIGLILLVIGVSAYFATQVTKVHIDTTVPAFEKIVTIESKVRATSTSLGHLTDTENQTYFAPEQVVLKTKRGGIYTLHIHTLANGTGYWVDTATLIPATNTT